MINLIERTIFMKYFGIYGSNGCGVFAFFVCGFKGGGGFVCLLLVRGGGGEVGGGGGGLCCGVVLGGG